VHPLEDKRGVNDKNLKWKEEIIIIIIIIIKEIKLW
jgi:hypothetical protein